MNEMVWVMEKSGCGGLGWAGFCTAFSFIFVSPILHGEQGVEHLIGFVEWLNALGATVDRSCGCHITVGIESIIGTSDTRAARRINMVALNASVESARAGGRAGSFAVLADEVRGDEVFGPYQSPMEDGMQHFHEWYRREMARR